MQHSDGLRWSQGTAQRGEHGELSAVERLIRITLLLAFAAVLVLEGWLLWQVWRLL
jgi:hypothetical protein